MAQRTKALTVRQQARHAARTPDLMGAFQAALEDAAMDQERKRLIGRRMRELRMRSPYKQPWLADYLGVGLRAYQKSEQTGGIAHDRLEKLAELYKVDVNVFYDPPAADEDEALAERMDRLEQKLDLLLDAFGIRLDEADPAARMKALLADAAAPTGRKPVRRAPAAARAAGARDQRH